MNKRAVIYLLLIAGLLSVSCKRKPEVRHFPTREMMEGDLAFRCGRGVFSRAVTAAEDKGIYSHVGVVVREGDTWKIVHAVPGEREGRDDFDRVKKEDIAVFFAPGRAFRGCLVHTGLTDSTAVGKIRADALSLVRDSVRFDHNYDLSDSSELYCTELVWLLYMRVGKDLSEGRRRSVHAISIDGPVLLPEHLLEYSGNNEYYGF